ncbi:hypothetical protein O6H91_14G027000 [Diphasiastrum complanatum]|uniref:Uncharacterized protein n=1 Tax=Diphasiastrum complanatum TaxID=34168 RepID=A0ACC2BMI8_DIPCM|nr:hypothetical protein O6H91_14G027000 [Diphasiastrum complanatum]
MPSFDTLETLLITYIVSCPSDFDKRFVVETDDASNIGFGALLFQDHVVIADGSRKFCFYETKCTTHEISSFPLKKWHRYLYRHSLIYGPPSLMISLHVTVTANSDRYDIFRLPIMISNVALVKVI